MSGVHPDDTSVPSNTSSAEHPAPPHKASTASHPPQGSPDPTLTGSTTGDKSANTKSNDAAQAQGGLSTTSAPASSELAGLTLRLKNSLRQFPDFPSPGILFEDIMPLFADPKLHEDFIRALTLHVSQNFEKPDVVVGLDARGFLFGPSLALRLGAGFAPVRKRGKLPGPCETAAFEKGYGSDYFQMQADAVKPGKKVLVVDDIIATGGSAAAAGSLVKKLGGTLLGYVFILELDFLKGRDKLDAPVYTLLHGQE